VAIFSKKAYPLLKFSFVQNLQKDGIGVRYATSWLHSLLL